MPLVLDSGGSPTVANDGAASVLGIVLRVCRLDDLGRIVQGPNNMIVSDAWMKVDFTPEMDTGIDTAQKNADGTLGVVWRTPDLAKRLTMSVQITSPDPELQELLAGYEVLSATAAALVAPTVTPTPSTTGGTLAAGVHPYQFTAMNYRGETLPATTVTATTTGSTGSVSHSIPATTGASAFGAYIGVAVGSATVFRRAAIIPAAASGATIWVDTGTAPAVTAPSPPTSDTTAGTGTEGFALPALLEDSNKDGCSLEAWSRATIHGSVPPSGPAYFHWVWPQVRLWTTAQRTLDTNAVVSTFSGFGFENPNWGTGPDGTWSQDSSRAYFARREARYPTPQIGYQATPASAY